MAHGKSTINPNNISKHTLRFRSSVRGKRMRNLICCGGVSTRRHIGHKQSLAWLPPITGLPRNIASGMEFYMMLANTAAALAMKRRAR